MRSYTPEGQYGAGQTLHQPLLTVPSHLGYLAPVPGRRTRLAMNGGPVVVNDAT